MSLSKGYLTMAKYSADILVFTNNKELKNSLYAFPMRKRTETVE
jgi:hypothetical protein